MAIAKKNVAVVLYDGDDEIIDQAAKEDFWTMDPWSGEWIADARYELASGTEYKIGLINHDAKRRANAVVRVDGKLVGKFRIERNSQIVVERPAAESKARKLTFHAVNSVKGAAGRLNEVAAKDLGFVVVEFYAEDLSARRYLETDECDGLNEFVNTNGGTIRKGSNLNDGGTVLGAKSHQLFVGADFMRVTSEPVTIIAKMVVKREPAIVPL